MAHLQFHAAGWHGDAHAPVVDNKYYDRATGKLMVATDDDHHEYQGPPAVDIIINSLYDGTDHCRMRAVGAFPMDALLGHIMRVVAKRKLGIDSVTATPFAIRVLIAQDITTDEFLEITDEMVNGIWDVKEEADKEKQDE